MLRTKSMQACLDYCDSLGSACAAVVWVQSGQYLQPCYPKDSATPSGNFLPGMTAFSAVRRSNAIPCPLSGGNNMTSTAISQYSPGFYMQMSGQYTQGFYVIMSMINEGFSNWLYVQYGRKPNVPWYISNTDSSLYAPPGYQYTVPSTDSRSIPQTARTTTWVQIAAGLSSVNYFAASTATTPGYGRYTYADLVVWNWDRTTILITLSDVNGVPLKLTMCTSYPQGGGPNFYISYVDAVVRGYGPTCLVPTLNAVPA